MTCPKTRINENLKKQTRKQRDLTRRLEKHVRSSFICFVTAPVCRLNKWLMTLYAS